MKDEMRILSWSEDGAVGLWDAATGQPIARAMEYDSRVYGAVLTKDETRLLSCSDDGTLRLWDAATGQPIGRAMWRRSGADGATLTKDEHPVRLTHWHDAPVGHRDRPTDRPRYKT